MKSVNTFVIIVSVVFIFGMQPVLHANPPPISVKLRLDNNVTRTYGCNDNVGIIIEVKNDSPDMILINEGFKSSRFALKMRIIDPAGRLLVPWVPFLKGKSPHTPPLPFVKVNGKIVRAVPCEKFSATESLPPQYENLSEYYNFELPGEYIAQVQVPVTIFRGPVCLLKEYQWLGVLKSETIRFSIKEKTPVRIIPEEWNLSWIKTDPGYNVEIRIPFPKGKTSKDYHLRSIRLNGQKGEIKESQAMIKIKFNGRDCVKSLKLLEADKTYRVQVLGRYSNNDTFCGHQRIGLTRK